MDIEILLGITFWFVISIFCIFKPVSASLYVEKFWQKYNEIMMKVFPLAVRESSVQFKFSSRPIFVRLLGIVILLVAVMALKANLKP